MPDPVPKRFFAEARVEPGEGGYRLLLDGRPARTPGRAPLALPSQALGEAVAAEWRSQGARIDPRSMPLTKLANSAIDGVAREIEAVRADIARYAGTDLVLYRAGSPDRLVVEQARAWDPVVAHAADAFGARLHLVEGVMHAAQPTEALGRIEARLAAETSAFRLAALHVLTTLSGSALIALMQAGRAIAPEAAWRAAHVDELFQESLWGADHEALQRRAAREAEYLAASRMLDIA